MYEFALKKMKEYGQMEKAHTKEGTDIQLKGVENICRAILGNHVEDWYFTDKLLVVIYNNPATGETEKLHYPKSFVEEWGMR